MAIPNPNLTFRFDSRASSETENDHYQADAEMNDKDDSDVDPISERIIGNFLLTFIMPSQPI